MAQSLEELSSIYSDASELGLTSLGVTQPHSLQHAPGNGGGGGRGGMQHQHGGQLMSRMMLADHHQQQQAHTTAASSFPHAAAVMRPASATVASNVMVAQADAGEVIQQQQQQLQQNSAASELDLGAGQGGERGGVQGGGEEAGVAGGELVMEECVELEEEGDNMDGREMEYDSDQGTLEGQTEGGPTKKRRTNYSYIPEDVKKRVVDYAFKHGTRPAARLFNISEGTIRSWKLRGFDKQHPVLSRGRKVTYGRDLDEELYLGLMAMLSERQLITVDMFTEYSKKIIDERRPELNFKCSRGWIDKFLNRHNLTVAKSEVGKVMHIVERPEIDLDHFSTAISNSNSASNECYLETDQAPELEITANESIDQTPYIVNNSACSTSQSLLDTPQVNENGDYETTVTATTTTTITPTQPQSKSSKIVASGYNSYLPPDMGGHLSEREQKKQKDVAKSRHIMDIVGKLNVVSSTSATSPSSLSATTNLDPQKRQEVVEYAKIHGCRSAEKMYAVPETTIIAWVKKASNKAPPRKRTMSRDEGRRRASNGGESSGSIDSHRVNSSPFSANTTHGGVSAASSTLAGGGSNSYTTEMGHFAPQANAQANVSLNYHSAGAENAEEKILVWALEQKRKGETLTFDSLCDQALAHVSQENPGSAYSSTRRWVDQFLNLKLKDVLNVHM